MGKFDGFLLCSDFDDTLYDDELELVPERNLRALERFEAEGGRFTVVTGRAHRTFAPYAHLAPLNAPAVLSNGSALYDFQRGELLLQTFLPDSAPEDFALLCRHLPSLGFEAYFGEEIYAYRPNLVTKAHMEKVGAGYETVERISHIPTPWTKAIFQQEREVLLEARRLLLSHAPERYEAIFSNHYFLEVTEKGSHKGGMVRELARRLGIAPEKIFCVGDNENDIPMLACSAIPFAPANCAQEVRDWGAKILCPCRQGVIGDIVEILEQRF